MIQLVFDKFPKPLPQGPKCFQSLRIPECILKQNWARNFLVYSPVIFVTVGLLYRTTIYCYDMYSDANVIHELSENEGKFKAPSFSDMFDSPENASKGMIISVVESNGGTPTTTEL